MIGKVRLNGATIGEAEKLERTSQDTKALFDWAWRYRQEADALNRTTDRQMENAARKTRAA